LITLRLHDKYVTLLIRTEPTQDISQTCDLDHEIIIT
jgi:hypothetical protein